ncbi:hypothetical protein [Alteromonas sp. S015]|uniref:hypothetical protein n=1 Tax=Alteromonas sp. S015 TaxID=3117401 RepID=UPI002FE3D42C
MTEENEVKKEPELSKVNDNLTILTNGMLSISSSVVDSIGKLHLESEKFAEKAPGQRSSQLGFLLVIAAFLLEIIQGLPTIGFEFSDTMSISMLFSGAFLVVLGGAFETFFTLKLAQMQEARAKILEQAAQTAMSQAEEVRKTSESLFSKLTGRA